MADLAPWQQRVLDEREALKVKFDALTAALQDASFGGNTRDLLQAQWRAMHDYMDVLNQRIALWG